MARRASRRGGVAAECCLRMRPQGRAPAGRCVEARGDETQRGEGEVEWPHTVDARSSFAPLVRTLIQTGHTNTHSLSIIVDTVRAYCALLSRQTEYMSSRKISMMSSWICTDDTAPRAARENAGRGRRSGNDYVNAPRRWGNKINPNLAFPASLPSSTTPRQYHVMFCNSTAGREANDAFDEGVRTDVFITPCLSPHCDIANTENNPIPPRTHVK